MPRPGASRRHACGGGETTLDNLALRCSAHKLYLAEQDFGVEPMDRAVAHARATCEAGLAQLPAL